MKSWFISAYITAVCYVIGAFINWDGNPGNWTEFARFTLVIFWFFINIAWIVHEENK
jgi:hypothetical protein